MVMHCLMTEKFPPTIPSIVNDCLDMLFMSLPCMLIITEIIFKLLRSALWLAAIFSVLCTREAAKSLPYKHANLALGIFKVYAKGYSVTAWKPITFCLILTLWKLFHHCVVCYFVVWAYLSGLSKCKIFL